MNVFSNGSVKRHRASWLDGRRSAQIATQMFIAATLILISGCATVPFGPPSGEEVKRIEDGEQVVVLARIKGMLNGAPFSLYEAAGSPPALQYRHISAGVDNYRHGDFYGDPSFLDQNTLSEGWFYFLVKPGDHNFWFMSNFGLSNLQAPFAMRHAPRYQFNVPEGVEVLYIGSFHIPVYERGQGSKWGKVDFNPHDAELIDETSRARDLARKSMPELEKFSAVLMEPKEEEDMILQKPGN